MKNNHYDVIVIGAGLGGLTGGCVFAQNNRKVLLIEQHSKVGGFATNFKRKDFVFDVSLHNMGPLYKNPGLLKIFQELNILNKIEYIPFDEFQRTIFPKHDFVIPKGTENYIRFLKETFPNEAKGIDGVFKAMVDIYEEFQEIENLKVPVSRLEEEFPLLPVKFPMLVTLVEKTFGQLMDDFISSRELKGIIGNSWWICGLPPSRLASILYSIPTVQYCNTAGGFIKGTSQKLSNAISEQIKINKGRLLLNTRVEKIITDAGRVKGVSTDNNESFFAPVIISNSSPNDTILKMLSEDEIDAEYRKRVENSKLSVSATQLFLGLSKNPCSSGMKNHGVAIFETYNHDDCYEHVLNGDYKKSFCYITNYTQFDQTPAPEGKGVLNILTLDHIKNWENLSKDEYKEKKGRVTKILIKKSEKIIPDLSRLIEVAELATPVTMRRYTGNPDGAVYGFAQTNNQSGINRFTHETPVKGLFLTGAYTYPGAGYSSVISSGYKTAKLIIEKGSGGNNDDRMETRGHP